MTSVADHLSSLTSGWELIQNAFADTKSRLVNIAPDRLTTLSLTVTAATSSTALDKHMIYDVLGCKQNLVALRAKIVKVTPKMRKPRSFFLNSASLQYKDASGPKGIKIFQNGRLHVTGCKSSTELQSTFDESLKLLTILNNKDVTITGFDVNMLNLQFYLNATLDIEEVVIYLRSLTESEQNILSVEYNPDKCPALMVRYSITDEDFMSAPTHISSAKKRKFITLMIYRKGCVKVYGKSKHEYAQEALKFILKVLDARRCFYVNEKS